MPVIKKTCSSVCFPCIKSTWADHLQCQLCINCLTVEASYLWMERMFVSTLQTARMYRRLYSDAGLQVNWQCVAGVNICCGGGGGCCICDFFLLENICWIVADHYSSRKLPKFLITVCNRKAYRLTLCAVFLGQIFLKFRASVISKLENKNQAGLLLFM